MSTLADGTSVSDGSLEDLRLAARQLFAAERRLRSRELPGSLGHAHIRTLQALGEQGEMTAGQIARSAEVTPASVTAMLDHLEAAGIVTRVRSTTDRRVLNVSLTPRGQALLAERTARWHALWEASLAPYDAGELAIVGRVMRDIAAMFDAIVIGPPEIGSDGAGRD